MASKKKKIKTNSSGLSGTIKKMIVSGEVVDIPKEIIGSVVSQVTKTKDDVTLRVTQEFLSLVRRIDFVKEFSKFAREHKFKVTAEIEVMRKDNQVDRNEVK